MNLGSQKKLALIVCSKKPYRTLEDYALTLVGIPPLTATAFKIRSENDELHRLYRSYLKILEYAAALGDLRAAKSGLNWVCRYQDFEEWAQKTGYMEAPAVENISQSKGVYADRDKDFLAWMQEEKPILSEMKKAEIHANLIRRNGGLWRPGFSDWWKHQEYHKGKSGRKPS